MKAAVQVLAVSVALVGVSAWSLADCGACGKSAKHGHDHHHDHAHAQVGKPAPDFTLTDLEGNKHKLSDLEGKVVVLEWTNFACPYVVRHQKSEKTMQKAHADYKDKGVVWLAIDSTQKDFGSGHAVKDIKNWADSDDVDLPYPVLVDADGQVGHLYEAKTTPHMYVIDKEGTLVYAGAIDDDPHGD